MDKLIDLHEQIVPEIDKISDLLVRAGAEHVVDRIKPGQGLPADAEIAELITMLVRFRTQAVATVTATLASSIESNIESVVSRVLADYLEKLAGRRRRLARLRRATRYGASVDSFSQVSSNSRSGSDAAMMPAPARSQVFPSHS